MSDHIYILKDYVANIYGVFDSLEKLSIALNNIIDKNEIFLYEKWEMNAIEANCFDWTFVPIDLDLNKLEFSDIELISFPSQKYWGINLIGIEFNYYEEYP